MSETVKFQERLEVLNQISKFMDLSPSKTELDSIINADWGELKKSGHINSIVRKEIIIRIKNQIRVNKEQERQNVKLKRDYDINRNRVIMQYMSKLLVLCEKWERKKA